MRSPVIHLRLAERLRAYAEAAAALGSPSAPGILRRLAKQLEADPRALRRVAQELAETARHFPLPSPYPVAVVWAKAADDASHPIRFRAAPSSPVGLAAVTPERRREIVAAAQSARRALPPERQRAIARKAAKTRAQRGTGRSGRARKLTDEQRLEVQAIWARGEMSQVEIAGAFGVSRPLIGQIVRGQGRGGAKPRETGRP